MTKTITDSYMELIAKFRLRQIRSDKEHREATKVIHSLLDKGKLDTGEKEYLDALSDLVWLYEEEHHAIEDLEPPEMLAGLIEHKDVSQRTVAAATGIPVSTISELISTKRGFTLAHVHKLADYFSVAPQVFLQTAKPRSAGRRKRTAR